MPYVAEEQICVNEKRDKVVPCDSPEAYNTLALPGVVVPDEDVKKYGLLKGGQVKAVAGEEPAAPAEPDVDEVVEEAEAEPEAEPDKEIVFGKAQSAPPQNKAKSGSGNK